MKKQTLAEAFEELDKALTAFKQQVAKELKSNPQLIIELWLLWIIIRLGVEYYDNEP